MCFCFPIIQTNYDSPASVRRLITNTNDDSPASVRRSITNTNDSPASVTMLELYVSTATNNDINLIQNHYLCTKINPKNDLK